MRIATQSLAAALALALSASAAASEWSYRGTLDADGRPAEGAYALRFTVFDAAAGGRALAQSVVVPDVAVHEGRFATSVPYDDALVQGFGQAWLQVEVAAQGEAFETLPRRQALESKALAAGVCWDTAGNAGNVDGTSFLGNTDNVPVELRVNNQRVARLSHPSASTVNVLLGASTNTIDAGASAATIGGGGTDSNPGDKNRVGEDGGTIGGGLGNLVNAGAFYGFVGGGQSNQVSGLYSTAAGGNANSASTYAFVGGGANNTAGGVGAVVAGGGANSAAGAYGVVPGGVFNEAGGDYSFAGGGYSVVRSALDTGTPGGDAGTFVWSDTSTNSGVISSGPNQFLVRANGGVAFNGRPNSNAVEFSLYGNNNGSSNVDLYMQPGGGNFGYLFVVDGTTSADTNWTLYHSNANGSFTRRLQVTPTGFLGINRGGSAITTPIVVGTSGSTGNGANLTVGGVWTNASSREFKHDFQPLDADQVLERVLGLSIQSWRYKDSDEGRHVGPVAEDFAEAFGLGNDAQHIGTVDEEGVALAAIQGLAQRLERQRDVQERLEAKLAELEAELERARSNR